MKFLVFAEFADGNFKRSVFECLGALASFGDVEAVMFSPSADDAKAKECAEHGFKKVHQITGPEFEKFTSDGYAQGLAELLKAESYDYVIGAGTLAGKDLLPRAAAKLNAPMVSDAIEIQKDGEGLSFKRPIYAGKVIQTVKAKGSGPVFATLRPNVFPMPSSQGQSGETTNHSFSGKSLTTIKEVKKSSGDNQLDLTEAQVIVAGGRSLKNGENFKILWDLAATMDNATVGASRAAVDAGYAPHSMQVGQTGKTVSPQLYIAFGISGAIQHLAGMRTSKVIVAINSDENAPIFQRADFGIVGDLFEIAPLMTKAIQEIKG